MNHFTSDLNELNREYSFLDEPVAGRLSSEFPALEHYYTAGDISALSAAVSQVSGQAKTLFLLPLNDHPLVRKSIEAAFLALAAGQGSGSAVDLDITAPHRELSTDPSGEGVSDHFLYGVSPNKLLRPAAHNPGWKILGPGTYTPRAAEVFADSRWSRLLNWMTGQSGGSLILLGPPLERYPELAALGLADQVLLFSGPLSGEQQTGLSELLAQASLRLPEKSALRLIWIGEEQPGKEIPLPAQETPESAKTAAETAGAATEELTGVTAGGESPAESMAGPAETPEPAEAEEVSSIDSELPEIEPLSEEEEPAALVSPPLDMSREALGEDEEEIFLPKELLFLDEDEETSAKEEAGGFDFEGLPDLKDVGGMGKEAEPAAVPSLPGELGPELSEEPLAAETAGAPESEEAAAEPVPADGPEEEISAGAEAETAAPIPETVESAAGMETGPPTAGEESEALYLDAEPEDELEMAAESAGEETGDAETVDEAALAGIESYEEALDATEPQEMALELDPNPLGEAESSEEISLEAAAEAGEEIVEAGAGEAQTEPPQAEAAEEAATEAPEEILEAGTVEAQPEPPEVEIQVEEVPEAAAEEAIEELGEDVLEELEMEDLEPVAGEELEAAPLESEAAAAPAETEETAAGEEAAPVEMEETAAGEEALPAGTAPEPEAAAGEATPVLEEAEEAAAAESEPAEALVAEPAGAAAEAGEKVPGEPSDDEIDNLLSGVSGLEEIGDDLALEEVSAPAPRAAPKIKKKKKKGSKSRALVTLLILISLAGGMFFVWKQGTVMSLVRGLPVFSALQELIPGLGPPPRTPAELAAERALIDSLREVARLAEAAPPKPQYAKLGYTIQLGSFRYLPKALEARDLLRERGMSEVYVVPLDLDSLGSWNRLYFGYYDSAEHADTALTQVLGALQRNAANLKLHGAAVRRFTPLALKIEDAFSADSLEMMKNRLERFDIPTYTVKLSADTTQAAVYRLYVGAFESREQALYLLNKLFNIGEKAVIIDREG